MPYFNVNVNVSSSSGGASNINIDITHSSSSYDAFCGDFDHLDLHDGMDRSRSGSASTLSGSRGGSRLEGRSERAMLDGPRVSSRASGRDRSPVRMLDRAHPSRVESSFSRRGSEFQTREVRPDWVNAEPPRGRYAYASGTTAQGTSFRVQEVRPSWGDGRTNSTVRGSERCEPSRADSRSGSTVRGTERRDFSRAESRSASTVRGTERRDASRTERNDSRSGSRFGSEVPGRETFRGSERGSSSTMRQESCNESRRAQESFSSSSSTARDFRTETRQPADAFSSRGSSREPRESSRSTRAESSSSRGFRTEERRPESTHGSSRSSSRPHESAKSHFGSSSRSTVGGSSQPQARLSLTELKSKFDAYQKNWDETDRISRTFPFPARGKDLYDIRFLTSGAPNDSKMSAEEVFAINSQILLLGGFGIVAFATTRSEKLCLGVSSSTKQEDLNNLLKYLKRTEAPRFHPDRMNLRTGVQGRVDESIGNRTEAVAMRLAVQRLTEWTESRIV